MLFATVLLAAEEGEAEGSDLIIPETSELIAGIIAFSIVFFVVWRWALPAFMKLLEDRQRAIGGQLQEAEEAKAEAESLLEDYRQQVAGAKAEANEIIEEARHTAEQVRTDTVSRAQGEADQIVARAREDAAAERDRAAAGLRREVADLSLDMAEKVVGEGLDRDAQRAMVDRFLEDLGGSSD